MSNLEKLLETIEMVIEEPTNIDTVQSNKGRRMSEQKQEKPTDQHRVCISLSREWHDRMMARHEIAEQIMRDANQIVRDDFSAGQYNEDKVFEICLRSLATTQWLEEEKPDKYMRELDRILSYCRGKQVTRDKVREYIAGLID